MITYDNWKLLEEYGAAPVLLLGSQQMDIPGHQGEYAVDFFAGGNVQDVDIDGNAVHTYDLTKYKASHFSCHTVADFGTLEHVEDIANALRNVYAWAEEKIIHVNPGPDYTEEEGGPHDGLPRFTPDFWMAYAKLCSLEIELLDTKPAYAGAETAIETRVVLSKNADSTAPKKKDIQSLLDRYVFSE